MSTFLDFQEFQVPLGSDIRNLHSSLRSFLTTNNWQILSDSAFMAIKRLLPDSNWNPGSTSGHGYPSLFDGTDAFCTTNSFWGYAPTDCPLWAGVEFASPVEVRRWTFDGVPSWAYWSDPVQESPREMALDYADDPAGPWTTVQTWDNLTWPGGMSREFKVTEPTVGNHLFWRVVVLTPGINGNSSGREIRFYDASGNMSSLADRIVLDLLPPDGEDVGDENGYDFGQLVLTSDRIFFTPRVRYTAGFKQAFLLSGGVTGSTLVQMPSVTIDGVTVQQAPETVSATNSAYQNTRFLLKALQDHTDPKVQDWTFEMNGSFIIMTKKTFGSVPVSTNPGTGGSGSWTLTTLAREAFPMTDGDAWAPNTHSNTNQSWSIPVDYTNGFVILIQLNARTIGVATKTNSAESGPIFLSWADHAQAMADMPSDHRYCTPMELFMVAGRQSANNQSTQYYVMTSKLRSKGGDNTGALPPIYAEWVCPYHPGCGARMANYLCLDIDGMVSKNQNFVYDTADYYGGNVVVFDGMFAPANWSNVANHKAIHSPGLRGGHCVLTTGENIVAYIMPFSLPDVKRLIWGVAIVNENAILGTDGSVHAALVNPIAATDNVVQVLLTDASAFPASGAFTMDGETFKYTGKVLNTLTGVTRAQYATREVDHEAGVIASPLQWFVKFNDFALMAGYTRP